MLPPRKSLGRSLNFAAGATNQLCNAQLERYGLQLPQWVVLSVLWQQDGLPVSEIARYNGSNVAAVSRLLDRMENSGLVVRRPDAEDRRAVRVWCTDQGRALDHLANFHEDINAALLTDLSPDEADTLHALLDRVTANARAAPR